MLKEAIPNFFFKGISLIFNQRIQEDWNKIRDEVFLDNRQRAVEYSYKLNIPWIRKNLGNVFSLIILENLEIHSIKINGILVDNSTIQWKAEKEDSKFEKKIFIPSRYFHSGMNEVNLIHKQYLNRNDIIRIIENIEKHHEEFPNDLSIFNLGSWDEVFLVEYKNQNEFPVHDMPCGITMSNRSINEAMKKDVQAFYFNMLDEPSRRRIFRPAIGRQYLDENNGEWLRDYVWKISLRSKEEKRFLVFYKNQKKKQEHKKRIIK